MIYGNIADTKSKKQLLQVFYQSIKMRSLLSYCVRIEHFDEYCLEEMKNTARELYISCCLYGQRNSPSLWTLCNVAPIHAEMCLKLYGMGLGCNTMEGREQKHQMIKQYSENTTFKNKWPMIFRHEFVHSGVLRHVQKKFGRSRVLYPLKTRFNE